MQRNDRVLPLNHCAIQSRKRCKARTATTWGPKAENKPENWRALYNHASYSLLLELRTFRPATKKIADNGENGRTTRRASSPFDRFRRLQQFFIGPERWSVQASCDTSKNETLACNLGGGYLEELLLFSIPGTVSHEPCYMVNNCGSRKPAHVHQRTLWELNSLRKCLLQKVFAKPLCSKLHY